MNIKKNITMTVRVPPRGDQPLSRDERSQLASLFILLMELKEERVRNEKSDY